MKILSAEFITSVAGGGKLPGDSRSIVALAGRSNVGKSSLINTLVKQRIARSGSTPGTTRLLNVYRVSALSQPRGTTKLTFVDLPGYGYARGGAGARRDFDRLTTEFFASARLTVVLLVVDARHPGLDADREAYAWLVEQRYRVVVVATKGDRLARLARQRAVRSHEAALGCQVVQVSNKTGDGTALLWTAITRRATGGRI